MEKTLKYSNVFHEKSSCSYKIVSHKFVSYLVLVFQWVRLYLYLDILLDGQKNSLTYTSAVKLFYQRQSIRNVFLFINNIMVQKRAPQNFQLIPLKLMDLRSLTMIINALLMFSPARIYIYQYSVVNQLIMQTSSSILTI